MSPSKSRLTQILGIILCLLSLSFLLISSALQESPVFDEPLHIAAGLTFWQHHDFRVEPFNPPLARLITTVPLIIFPDLFNQNYFVPRLMVIISTLILALIVYKFSQKLFGRKPAIFSLILFIFESNILTHGHYATTDMIATTFFIGAIFVFWSWGKSLNLRHLIVIGSVIGLTLSTKLTTLFYLALALPVLAIGRIKLNVSRIGILILSAFLVLWATYFFTFEPALGYRTDQNRPALALAKKYPLVNAALIIPLPLGSYLSTVKQIFVYNYTSLYQKSPFLMGKFSTVGFWEYYPVTILIKTSPVLMIFFLFALSIAKKRKNINIRLILIMLAILGVTLFSRYNLGVRYILPIYPLLIIFSSQAILIPIRDRIFKHLAITVLLVGYIFETLSVYPHYISYFNSFAGGPNNGYHFIVDSSTDWGQGLLDLRKFQLEYTKSIQLAYFGSVDPSKFGITYTRVLDLNMNNPREIQEYDPSKPLVVSETCWYYCGYSKNPLLQFRSPDKIIGGSLLLFLPE